MDSDERTAWPATVAALLWQRRDDPRPAIRSGDDTWSWARTVAESGARRELSRDWWPSDRALHIGVLLDNCPEYLFWLGAAALGGATLAGLNPTHGDADLAAEIDAVDLDLVVTDAAGAARLAGLAGEREVRVLTIDDEAYQRQVADLVRPDATPEPAAEALRRQTRLLLLFTSGTTGRAKAAICSQGRLADLAELNRGRFPVGADDVCYCPMPLFHGNALMALWAPALAAGATVALAPRFSASGFVDDVRRYQATFFSYVGRAIRYVLATPASAADTSLSLTHGFGTEASPEDVREFAERFGCRLIEGYGSSEAGGLTALGADVPPTALGRPARPGVRVVDPATREQCVPARFDGSGRLVNADAAVGEIVDVDGAAKFEGYYRNSEANAERVRHGWYWTGDLGFVDEAGFLYFAGRAGDWIRVDSENISALTVERVLRRHPLVVNAVAYGVPDPQAGDQVMAALELREGADFAALGLADFLAGQVDLGTKGAPSLVRVGTLPVTGSGKVRKQALQVDGWRTAAPVWRRTGRHQIEYRLLEDEDKEALRAEFARYGRLRFLPEAGTAAAANKEERERV